MTDPDMKTGPLWQDEASINNGVPEPFIRCARCGFMCNLKRDHHSYYGSKEGWGTTITPVSVTQYDYSKITYDDELIPFDGKIIYDPVVNSGCPKCGTLLYHVKGR